VLSGHSHWEMYTLFAFVRIFFFFSHLWLLVYLSRFLCFFQKKKSFTTKTHNPLQQLILSLALLNKSGLYGCVPGSLFFELPVALSPLLFPILLIPTCCATFVIRSTMLYAQPASRPPPFIIFIHIFIAYNVDLRKFLFLHNISR